jgi:hypothetical protein
MAKDRRMSSKGRRLNLDDCRLQRRDSLAFSSKATCFQATPGTILLARMSSLTLQDALTVPHECESLDFKRTFDPSVPGDWPELLKDIVAMANSGGGIILVGVDDDGVVGAADLASATLAVDPADVTNKIYKYTDCHFSEFQIRRAVKDGVEIAAIIVGKSSIPMVFTQAGAYLSLDKKEKRAFSPGTVYFRHGAKSEPGNSNDLRAVIEREVESMRKSWLDGIAKVVEAPPGAKIEIIQPNAVSEAAHGVSAIRLVEDINAPAVPHVHVDKTHPHRQKEVVQLVNERLRARKTVTSFDIVCLRRVYEIQKKLNFCYTLNHVSPRYSDGFIDWIVEQFEENVVFFEDCRKSFDKLKAEATAAKTPTSFAT